MRPRPRALDRTGTATTAAWLATLVATVLSAYALDAIAAAVIGGASLNGGSGTIFGAILGMALLSVVTSSLILLDVSVYWQDIIRGSILLTAVTIDHYLNKRRG